MTYHIETLSAPRADGSEAFALTQNGDVAGAGYSSPIEGVIWRDGEAPHVFGDAHGLILYGLNNQGDAVGVRGWNNSSTEIAILLRGNQIEDLTRWVGQGAIAADINSAGLVCGSNFWNTHRAFIFNSVSQSIQTFIDPLPGDVGVGAHAINEVGAVVGMSEMENRSGRGYYFQNGVYTELGEAASIDDLNDKGQICGAVGRAYPQVFAPHIWDVNGGELTITEIPVPAGFLGGHAEGINNSGAVVGTCWTADSFNGRQSAYVYENGVSTDLNDLINPQSGWHLEFAEAINDSGQIAGSGYLNGAQVRSAFLLTPIRVRRPGRPIDLRPKYTSDFLVTYLFGGAAVDGGGFGITPGGEIVPIGPWNPLLASMPAAKRDALLALLIDELAGQLSDHAAQQSIRKAALETARRSVETLLNKMLTPSEQLYEAEQTPARTQAGKSVARFNRTMRTGNSA